MDKILLQTQYLDDARYLNLDKDKIVSTFDINILMQAQSILRDDFSSHMT